MNLNSYFWCKDTANYYRFQIIGHILFEVVATPQSIRDRVREMNPFRVVKNTFFNAEVWGSLRIG